MSSLFFTERCQAKEMQEMLEHIPTDLVTIWQQSLSITRKTHSAYNSFSILSLLRDSLNQPCSPA